VGLGLTALVAGGPTRAMASGLAGGRLVRTPLDVALTDLAAPLLLGCATWWWMATTVVVVEATCGVAVEARGRHGVPASVRRVVLAACGVTLAGALAQPSYAVSAQTHLGDRPCHQRAHHGLAGLPLPDRAAAPRHGGRPGHRRSTHETVVVVTPGDTLWAIAVRGLPPGSPDARIAVRWHAIYAANRSLIGPDPNLIVPGQRLLLSGKEPS
jgi:nucleoid-associated protein YgaU